MGETESSGNKFSLTGFWEGVKSEFKKIIWPTRDEVITQTISVIAISTVLGLIIAAMDTIIVWALHFVI